LEDSIARSIFLVEKEVATHIDDEYPLMKFYSLMDYLTEFKQKEKEVNQKAIKK